MANAAHILDAARAQGHAENLAYAGAVTPEQAYALLQAESNCKLIDVRTNAERDWVGRVNLPLRQQGAIEWNTYPANKQNPEFLTQLAQTAKKDTILLFLCRSGARSQCAAALATQNGYLNCFDILDGFEGGKDSDGHRKTSAGWCYVGLPWLGA
ncbi:MAG: rhodanese-like domain-containing protein [Herbaspirillum sp.]